MLESDFEDLARGLVGMGRRVRSIDCISTLNSVQQSDTYFLLLVSTNPSPARA